MQATHIAHSFHSEERLILFSSNEWLLHILCLLFRLTSRLACFPLLPKWLSLALPYAYTFGIGRILTDCFVHYRPNFGYYQASVTILVINQIRQSHVSIDSKVRCVRVSRLSL